MNEIERAIEDFQRWAYMEGISDSTYETVIAALRAELSRQENAPLTWNERINQMTVEEKGEFFAMFNCPISLQSGYDCSKHANCTECMTAFFASPYTEGGHRR